MINNVGFCFSIFLSRLISIPSFPSKSCFIPAMRGLLLNRWGPKIILSRSYARQRPHLRPLCNDSNNITRAGTTSGSERSPSIETDRHGCMKGRARSVNTEETATLSPANNGIRCRQTGIETTQTAIPYRRITTSKPVNSVLNCTNLNEINKRDDIAVNIDSP